MRYSAIDIGSNAIRMMIAEFSPTMDRRIIKKWRAPVRLGEDVFISGEIGTQSLRKALATFKKFQSLNKKYKVQACRAVGTSALREAKNGNYIIKEIARVSSIRVEIIDGLEEARLIHRAVAYELNISNERLLSIDIGGGSVELTYSSGPKIKSCKSFPLGTVRILNLLKSRKLSEKNLKNVLLEFRNPITSFLKSGAIQKDFRGIFPLRLLGVNSIKKKKFHLNSSRGIVDHLKLSLPQAAGTGGNLECLGRLKVQLLKKTPNTYVTHSELLKIILQLKKISVKNRIEKLGLRPDRADVILPAAMVIEMILREAGVKKLLLPGVGLRDGILLDLISGSRIT